MVCLRRRGGTLNHLEYRDGFAGIFAHPYPLDPSYCWHIPVYRSPITGVALRVGYGPLNDKSVDQVVTTWTLCTIPDPVRALREWRRVLKPGGQLLFIEHGRSPQPTVATWQDRLTPVQKVLCGGCHLNRPIDTLIQSAGFQIETLRKFYMKAPRVMGYIYQGMATNVSSRTASTH
ncbi:MAG: class I SAM-dependent methyltransferase [Bdellovibrionales bacterium]